MKTIFVVLCILLFLPYVSRASSVCTSSALIVEGIARDRDQGIPIQQEFLNVNMALQKMGLLTRENMEGMEIVVRSVYQSADSPSTLMRIFLSNCQEP